MTQADPYSPGESFNGPKAPMGSGIAYFLPRRLAQVVVSRVEVARAAQYKTLSDAMSAQSKAQDALATAKADVGAASAAVTAAEDAIIGVGSPTSDGLTILKDRLARERDALAAAKVEQGKRETALAAAGEAVVALKVAAPVAQAPTYTSTVEITLLPPSADPTRGFRLDPRHSLLRDDTHKLVVSPGGLLTSTNVVAVDRTGDVIVELARAVAAATGAVPARPPGSQALESACAAAPAKVTLLVDFSSASAVTQDANAKLACMGVRLDLVGTRPDRQAVDASGSNAQAGNGDEHIGRNVGGGRDVPPASVDGVVYRTPVEQLVAVEACQLNDFKDCHPESSNEVDTPNATWRTTQVLALKLPQAGPISYLRQDAGFFTKTTYDVAFQDGILTTYSSERPSEVAEAAGLPIRVIDGVFDGISHVISLRTGVENARSTFSAAQKSAISAQYDVLITRIKSSAALTDSAKAQLASQVALRQAQIGEAGTLADAQAALLQQQTNLSVAENNAVTQLSGSRLATIQKQLHDEAALALQLRS